MTEVIHAVGCGLFKNSSRCDCYVAEKGTPTDTSRSDAALRAGNPVTWLKSIVDAADLPPELKAHIDRQFYKHLGFRNVDPESAWPLAMKLAARIHWARVQHALMSTNPSSPKYFILSKVATMWATNALKVSDANKKARTKQPQGKDLRPAPTRSGA